MLMDKVAPNTKLKKQIDDLKDLVECLPLNPDQKSSLYKLIHDRKPVSNLPLNEKQAEVLNKYIGRVCDTYYSEMAEARRCPAISDWMTEPTDVVFRTWDYLIEQQEE